MTPFLGHYFRTVIAAFALGLVALVATGASATQFAAFLMDARTGETLFAKNADTPLPPASLTKMMTLYLTFQDIQAGKVTLDTMITVSKNAANQAPTRLGLKAGQKVALRYLIRAAAVKSANDAAAAIGDALGGSQQKWAARMTSTAKRLGMQHSTFKNANGLSAKGHLSTAHDMSSAAICSMTSRSFTTSSRGGRPTRDWPPSPTPTASFWTPMKGRTASRPAIPTRPAST